MKYIIELEEIDDIAPTVEQIWMRWWTNDNA